MKLKHTQAKKANRCSAFKKSGRYDESSMMRQMRRESLQPVQSKIFGKPKKYVQPVLIRRLGGRQPMIKNIVHAMAE